MLKLLIALVILAHGVGHLLFLVPTVRVAAWADQTGHSWALAPLLGDGLSRLAGGLIWLSATFLFIAAVAGFMTGAEWWRVAAISGAFISAAGIVLMWDGILATSALLALVFDGLVLGALLWANWPTADITGS